MHISLSIGHNIEGERESKRERCEMVKTGKWYYVCNMRSAYFPINGKLHREGKREREQETERATERKTLRERE